MQVIPKSVKFRELLSDLCYAKDTLRGKIRPFKGADP
jgi:hypothetical protein